MLRNGISRERLLLHRTDEKRGEPGTNGRHGRKRTEGDAAETKQRSKDHSRLPRVGEQMLQRNVRPLRPSGRCGRFASSSVPVQTATNETRSSLQIDGMERSSDEPNRGDRSFPPKPWGGSEKIRPILPRVRFPFQTRFVPFEIGPRTEDRPKIFLGNHGTWLALDELGLLPSRASGCHVRKAQDQRRTSLRVPIRGAQGRRLQPDARLKRAPSFRTVHRPCRRSHDACDVQAPSTCGGSSDAALCLKHTPPPPMPSCLSLVPNGRRETNETRTTSIRAVMRTFPTVDILLSTYTTRGVAMHSRAYCLVRFAALHGLACDSASGRMADRTSAVGW